MTIDDSPNAAPSVPVGGRMAKFILFLLIALCVLFIASYTNRSAKRAQVEEQIGEWEARIEREVQNQAALQAELEYIASADYLDEVARDELNLYKEGDTVIVVLPGKEPAVVLPTDGGQSSGNDNVGGQSSMKEPIWQQWLTLFATSSDP